MLLEVYSSLRSHFGPQKWWPVFSEQNPKLEIALGAILTQQTSWKNVEKAIKNLAKEELFDIRKLEKIDQKKLQDLIRPSGYYRQKARRIKNFVNFLSERHGGDLESLLSHPTNILRESLLSVNGIGKETADSIILYAAEKPTFVIDAYTRRVFNRLGVTHEQDYEALKGFFESRLEPDVDMFKEFHALIVELAKNYCKKRPLCLKCPLKMRCQYANDLDNLSQKGK